MTGSGIIWSRASGSSPSLAVKTISITADGLNWLRYSDSRSVPTQEEGYESDAKRISREKAIADGKLAPEEADSSVDQTPKAFYVTLSKDISDSLANLKALESLADEKFGDVAPSFGKLRGELTQVATTIGIILKKKRELEPDPEGEAAPEEMVEGGEAASAGPSALGEIKNRDDAVAHVLAGIQYLRTKDPQNPAGYLAARGLRWGELRAAGAVPDPKSMVAAPIDLRTQIKNLALDGKWPELLEACERGSAMACGRGWLDMQRYAIRACEELGEPYQPVARALRSELRALLMDYPRLPEMFLMDDTPTANLETQKWLRGRMCSIRSGCSIRWPPIITATATESMSARLRRPIPEKHERGAGGADQRAGAERFGPRAVFP